MRKYLIFVLVLVCLVAPVSSSLNSNHSFVYAQNETTDKPSPNSTDETNKPVPTTSNVQINLKVQNPIGKVDSVEGLIAQLIKIALLIGVPILVLSFIYIGYLFVAAQGNPEKIKKAKGYLQWAVVGAFLLLGASVLAEAIKGTVDQLK